MKRVYFCLLLAVFAYSATAQTFEQDADNRERYSVALPETRAEIIIPAVNGYKVLKADLHVHTTYSDGMATPKFRVMEAWRDGMDVIAITDHIEYRPHEKYMAQFLGVDAKGVGDQLRAESDFNLSVKRAVSAAKYYDVTVIPGIEITRNPKEIGHFNALFTTDNNLIPDENPLQAIRNAKKQGAIIQANHPGWHRKNNDFTKVAKEALKENLIDGVEIFNTEEFYPNVIEEAARLGLYVSGCTDLHRATYDMNLQYGAYRTMTLLLATENSHEAIRDALVKGRTIAYSYGNFAAQEQFLVDMCKACIIVENVHTSKNGRQYLKITNKSSFPFSLSFSPKGHTVNLPPLSSIMYTEGQAPLTIIVKNMWYGPDKHPVVVLEGVAHSCSGE